MMPKESMSIPFVPLIYRAEAGKSQDQSLSECVIGRVKQNDFWKDKIHM